MSIDKSLDKIASVKVYLGAPWFNDRQRELVENAAQELNNNATVQVVHQPFQHQYKGVTLANPKGIFGSREWIQNTIQNDLTAMTTSDAAIFLYDMDNEDPGCCFEIGWMRAMNKPVILYLVHTKPSKEYEMNLMLAGVTAIYDVGNGDDLSKIKDYNFDHMPSNINFPVSVF